MYAQMTDVSIVAQQDDQSDLLTRPQLKRINAYLNSMKLQKPPLKSLKGRNKDDEQQLHDSPVSDMTPITPKQPTLMSIEHLHIYILLKLEHF
jgi:hypothetical protein